MHIKFEAILHINDITIYLQGRINKSLVWQSWKINFKFSLYDVKSMYREALVEAFVC